MQNLVSGSVLRSLLVLDLGGTKLLLGVSLGVRIESEENLLVLKRVLLNNVLSLLSGLTSGSEDLLDLRGVDQASDISVGKNVSREGEARLGRGSGLSTPDAVKGRDSRLSPDDESTEVGTRGKLKKGERSDVGGLNTGDVSESVDETLVLTVDDQRTLTLSVTATSELTLTGTELLGSNDLGDITVSTDSLQDSNSLLGLLNRLNIVGDNEGNLGNALNTVTSGENKRGNSGSSNGRSSSVSLLVVVDLDVPLSPGLGRSEHTTATAHVTESSLTSTVSTRTTDTGDTGNSTTGTPGDSGGLLTSVGSDGVSLTLVLGNTSPDRVNNVGTDGGLENGGENDVRGGGLTGCRVDSNLRAGDRHYNSCVGMKRLGDGWEDERQSKMGKFFCYGP